MNLINSLDLEPIKVKLMHKESGEGWSLERANAIEIEYRRFLFLMKQFPHEQAAPLVDVDTFWHYHILDTMKYAADCDTVFGHFLHHFPYIGLRGEDDLAAHERLGLRMQQLYEATFGEPYLRGAAHQDVAYSAATGQSTTAYSAVPGVVARTAYSAVASVAAQTAYSAVASAGAASIAAQTAYSAVAGAGTVAAKTAYSAATNQVAYSAAPGQPLHTDTQANAAIEQARLTSFFSERPRLTPTN